MIRLGKSSDSIQTGESSSEMKLRVLLVEQIWSFSALGSSITVRRAEEREHTGFCRYLAGFYYFYLFFFSSRLMDL